MMQGLDYDLWANERWIPYLEKFSEPSKAEDILNHIVRAQKSWLERCLEDVEGYADVPDVFDRPWEVRVRTYVALWKELLYSSETSSRITYMRQDGTEYENRLDQIANHVLNHGTYHRGQLRAMAEAEGLEWPETDLIFYLRVRAEHFAARLAEQNAHH